MRSEVSRLAGLVAEGNAPLSTWEARLYQALGQISEVDLGWWEQRYRHVHWHGRSELRLQPTKTVDLFDEIFEFGSYNLYTQFKPQQTARQHFELINRLSAELGIEILAGSPPRDW